MTHFLVTGGAGFVGSHLVDRLVTMGRVTVLDNLTTGQRDNVNAKAELVVGDVRDAALTNRLINHADAVFHLAAIASVQQCMDEPAASHAVNLSAFVGMLDSSRRRAGGVVPIIYASSAAVYGDTDVTPVNEGLPLRPISIYGADKAGCELHARAAGQRGVPTFGLRPFNIYGPRQLAASPYSGVITVFTERLRRNQPIIIYGDGRQTRDFIHISDVVDFFVAALDKVSPKAPVCNAATGKETSVVDLAKNLCALLGHKEDIQFAPARPGDIRRSVADISLAREMLGCVAKVEVAEGLVFVRQR
ncbi:MAG: NAD-dependent epimerase/dehydratase family protein [Alphaproteobacteria bacterium]|nr:NAD-dependent epimerase/dehydratase family protein [Alphaproteobacteria bacterium]